MCKYFKKCYRTCKSEKTHFRHWEHVRKYAEKKYPNYINYRTYVRLSKSAQNDMSNICHIEESDSELESEPKSQNINYTNLERYLVTNMVEKMIYDIVDKL